MSSVAADALHTRLRQQTQHVHAALDESLRARPFFTTLAGYQGYLRSMLAFQGGAEDRLHSLQAAQIVPDWQERRRAGLAAADLVAVQHMTGEPSPAIRLNMGEVWAPPELALRPREEVLGLMYVLEGSTLGGAVLLKAVAPLGVSADQGASYLASYGSRRGMMWRRFLSSLGDWDARGVDQEAVIQAAHTGFRAAAYCLDSHPAQSPQSNQSPQSDSQPQPRLPS